jgi:hypothetical protein
MLSGMQLLFASFCRALLYCLYPRVIALSILPLVLLAGTALGLGYFFWEPVLDMVRSGLDSYGVLSTLWAWLQSLGIGNLKTVVAPLIVIFAVTPLLVLICLLVVAAMMTPAMTALVAKRRYADLKREQGGSVIVSIWWSLSSVVLAVVAMVVSVPLWLIPPLVLVVPPLIWGWLTYRVMAYDALSTHASKFAFYRTGLRVSGCSAQLGVGVRRHVCRCFCDSCPRGNLDVHPGFCIFLTLVCPLLPSCLAGASRSSGCASGSECHCAFSD